MTRIKPDGYGYVIGPPFLIFVIGRREPCWAVCVEAISTQPEPSRIVCCQSFIYTNRMTSAYDMSEFYGVEPGSRPMTQARGRRRQDHAKRHICQRATLYEIDIDYPAVSNNLKHLAIHGTNGHVVKLPQQPAVRCGTARTLKMADL